MAPQKIDERAPVAATGMTDLNLIAHPLIGTPFGAALDLCLLLAAVAWVLSIISREYSWVDRLWSLCPPIYCLLVAAAADFDSARLNLMAALVTLWGVRLTFNYARKGGYWKGGEDYRWTILRERLGAWQFQALNLVFTHFGQMLIIWLFTAPVHQAWLFREAPLTWVDSIAVALFIALLLGETVADEQMWAFQQDKKRKIASGEAVEQPFLNTGLYAHSRHPNYCCEMGIWWVFYGFAVIASGQWLHWTGLGCIVLTLLFIPSTRLGESISLDKYPGYRDYQASTPRFIPMPRRRG